MLAVKEDRTPVTLQWIENFLELLDGDGQQSDKETGQLVHLDQDSRWDRQGRRSDAGHKDRWCSKVNINREANPFISVKDKGKRASVKAPKRKPPFDLYSNSNAKLILEKKKGVSEFDVPSSSSSSESGRGTFVNSILAKDNGLGLSNLESAQDRGLSKDGLLIDFSEMSDSSLEGEDFHIDLNGGPEPNGGPNASRVGSSKARKLGFRERLQSRKAKKIQLMMKKGLLKTSLVRNWLGIQRRRGSKEALMVNAGNSGAQMEACEVFDKTEEAPVIMRNVPKGRISILSSKPMVKGGRNPELKASGMHVLEIEEFGTNDVCLSEGANQNPLETMVSDVDGNQVVWDLEAEFARVIETGAALNFNLERNYENSREEHLSQEEEFVIDVDGNMVEWNVEAEISKVIETGAALGIDFGGKEESIRVELRRRDKEDDERLAAADRA
ncbi:hypothetical protein Q3G72_033525 [Acer saccharum]|nr:hypothetical protein Q3G72_033525 [Acer saccharum]